MKKNTMSASDFTLWTICGIIIGSFLIRSFWVIYSYGTGDTIVQLAISFSLWFILIRRNRNYSSVVLIILFPIVILETLKYWESVSIVKVVTAAAVLIAMTAGALLSRKNALRVRTTRARKNVIKRTFFKSFCMTACMIMLVGAIYGRTAHLRRLTVLFRNILSDYEADDTSSEEYTIANNIETLSRLDSRGGWKTATLEEKVDVLETVVKVECRYLGMQDTLPSLNIAYTDAEELLGFYDKESDTITLSYAFLMKTKANGYSVCQVLCHELYHRMQYRQIEMLEHLEASEDTEKYAKLLLLHDTDVYRDEVEHYIDGKDNYALYATQQLESDADAYGEEASFDYYKSNQKYYEQQSHSGAETEAYEPSV